MHVKGLTDVYVGSQVEVFEVMKAGAKSRVVASTSKPSLLYSRCQGVSGWS